MKRKSKNFSGLDTCPSKSLSVDNINLSFAGCGFNGIYHVGVASCFLEYCPKVSFNKLSGVSAGSLVATALACQLPLGESPRSRSPSSVPGVCCLRHAGMQPLCAAIPALS